MKKLCTFLLWMAFPLLLPAQSGFAETYEATAGYEGKIIATSTYGYKIFATKTGPNTLSRLTFESGADGTFWGITSALDYPRPLGTLLDVAPAGDYVTAETFATPSGITLRIRRWFPNWPGYYNNLAEINFPDAAQLNLELLNFRDEYPGGVFLAGHYRTAAEPQQPVPFLVRSSSSTFEWWIQMLADIPPTTFAYSRLTAFSDGGCALVFKKTDEHVFIERFNALGSSLWRREVGFLDQVTALTEGPGGQTCYTVADPPFSGPNPTYGTATVIAPDGAVILEKNLNTLLGQYSVVPGYILPLLNGGAVIAGFESPVLGISPVFFAAKLNAAGQVVWKKNYHYFQQGAAFTTARVTADNGYVFTGDAGGQVFLFKVDQYGTGGVNVQYCPAKSGNPWQEWIAEVRIGSIQNASGKSQYSNFLALSTALGIGASADLNVTAGFSYFTYDQYIGVWIDYNRDNMFGSNEKVVEAILPRPPDGSPVQLLSAHITVPSTAQPGPTRMRVIMQRDAFNGPCDNPVFGEVEDYTVDLKTVGLAPDLSTPAWELIPANGSCFTNPGQAFGFLAGLVLNTGPAGAGHFTAKAWLSSDNQFGNADDLLWEVVHYDTLAPGGAPNNPLSVGIQEPVPVATPPGLYHLFVQVDADQELAELDESNNVFHGTTQIGAPDYYLQNVAGLPATVAAGSTLDFSYVLQHSNTFPLTALPGALHVSISLSPDQIAGNGNDVLLGSQSIDYHMFDIGGMAQKTVSLPVPGIVTAGSYFLLIALTPAQYCDQNYQNNTFIGPAIQVLGPSTGVYCGAQGDFPWHEWIAGVGIADLVNGSGKSSYSDFSALTASLVANDNVPVVLSTGFSWTASTVYWKIWIDYNRNGVFEEPGEIAFQQVQPKPVDGTPMATLSGSFTVPATTSAGLTRMRVAMKRNATPEPCEHFNFGEVEDYSVLLVPSFQPEDKTGAIPAMPDFILFPNPAVADVFLTIPKGTGNVAVNILDQNGQLRWRAFFEKPEQYPQHIDLITFQSGMYLVQILPENGPAVCKKLGVFHP